MAQVMGKFYEQGKLMVTVDARRAVFSVQTQDVTLSGEVHVRAADGRTLDADHVQWLAARRLVLANGNVRLTQARYVVQADRLESDIALQRTKLRGHIRVTVRE
jgi:LPS export ABC transporter protein LptC